MGQRQGGRHDGEPGAPCPSRLHEPAAELQPPSSGGCHRDGRRDERQAPGHRASCRCARSRWSAPPASLPSSVPSRAARCRPGSCFPCEEGRRLPGTSRTPNPVRGSRLRGASADFRTRSLWAARAHPPARRDPAGGCAPTAAGGWLMLVRSIGSAWALASQPAQSRQRRGAERGGARSPPPPQRRSYRRAWSPRVRAPHVGNGVEAHRRVLGTGIGLAAFQTALPFAAAGVATRAERQALGLGDEGSNSLYLHLGEIDATLTARRSGPGQTVWMVWLQPKLGVASRGPVVVSSTARASWMYARVTTPVPAAEVWVLRSRQEEHPPPC